MYNIGEEVFVKDALAKGTQTRCKIVDKGVDEDDIIYYSCIPTEFDCPVAREFPEDKLMKIS